MSIDLYDRDAVLTPIRQMLDSFQRENGSDRLNPPLPERVHNVVRTLLAGVSVPCRQMLCTAAVLGSRLDPEVLAQMLGQTTVALLPVWEEALSSEVLVPDGDELAFAHELLRRAVAESLPPAIRDAVKREHGRLAPCQHGTADVLNFDKNAPQMIKQLGENPASVGRPLGKITNRERTVLSLVAHGRSNRQIARALNISDHAVKRHVSNLLLKFNCSNRTEIALLAIKHQWDDFPVDATA